MLYWSMLSLDRRYNNLHVCFEGPLPTLMQRNILF